MTSLITMPLATAFLSKGSSLSGPLAMISSFQELKPFYIFLPQLSLVQPDAIHTVQRMLLIPFQGHLILGPIPRDLHPNVKVTKKLLLAESTPLCWVVNC